MVKLALLTILGAIPFLKTHKQHCAFDGASLVVIKVTDKEGKSIPNYGGTLMLIEVNNLIVDSCKYANENISLRFKNLDDALLTKYPNTWIERAPLLSKNCSFMQPGHLAVVLNQAQTTCMISQGKNYDYRKRQFIITQERDGKKHVLSTVNADKIYTLCTSAGSWKRIEPITIIAD